MKVYFLIAECSLSSAKILKIEGDSLEKVEECTSLKKVVT